ncbi:MAG: ABC transporter permease [Chloroflexota bacterium]|nr:ABC transporter permease [Chloroflexota bacterium]
MTAGKAHVQNKGGLWRELLNGWTQIITEPSLEKFREQKARADPLKTTAGVALLGLAVGLLAAVIKPPSMIVETETILADFLRIIFFTLADFFIFNLIIFFVAKSFSGSGSFNQQSYLLSLVVVPLCMIVITFLFLSEKLGLALIAVLNPLSPVGIVGILIFLFCAYGLLLLLFALQTAHEMPASSVVYTLGVPLLGWGVLRVASMFAVQEENMITSVWSFIADQWAKGYAQELLIGHIWLVLFSVVIAVVIGIMIGIFITWPSRRPQLTHLVILIPLGLFFLLWAASTGMMGEATAETIMNTVKGWDRAFTRVDGLFAPFLDILGAIISKPAVFGMIGAVATLTLYSIYLAGEAVSELTLYIAGIILTIPSVALFGVMIKPLGIGPFNAAFALILYAQLPILRNTYTGIKDVPTEIIEAGRGMGMTELQLLLRVKLPMATPVIMTGVRVAIVMLVGIAAIAAYIGNDTLGEYIFSGISRAQEKRYIAGAILVAVLALAVDYFMGWLQGRLTPEGLKSRQEM